jgi:curli biogenesis system outer membrane secretion channel CsgG
VDQLPGDWVVDDVTKAPLVICVSPKEQGDIVESCEYESGAILSSITGTTTVSFHKIAIPIRVVEVQTGHVVADLRVQVNGTSCPSVISYTTYGNFDTGPDSDMYVDAPDSAVSAAVRDALAPIINP